MQNKQNPGTLERGNDIELELERIPYLIDSDELMLETLGETFENESGRFTKPLHMGVLEDINLIHTLDSEIELLQSQEEVDYMTLTRQYKCPTCKNEISIMGTDFINGIVMTTCCDCGRNAFAIEDVLLNG